MIQQKQQKNTRTQNGRYKDQAKIGFLAKISNLPRIETHSSSRSKFRQSLDNCSSHKKHKISDIFYEEVSPKRQDVSKMNQIIIQKDSILQHSSRYQEDKQQTVMKIHQKRKPHENQFELCHFHHQKLKNEVQKEQISQIRSSRIRVYPCCETEPSESHYDKINRFHMYFNRNLQSKQKLKNSILKTPEKLKPIKFNKYQKPQLFDNKTSKHHSADKIFNHKGFLSPVQAKIISDKLSQPKCTSNCGKKNCQCFNQNQLKKMSPFKRRNIHMASEKQIALKKINININRLKNIQNQENVETQDQQNFNNLRRKINEKKTWRKNMKLKQIKRFDTEVIQNDKFFNQSSLNQNKTQHKDFSSSKISSQSDKFFKGPISPVKNILAKSNFTQSEVKLNYDLINKVNLEKKYRTIDREAQNEKEQRRNSHPVQNQIVQDIENDSRIKQDKHKNPQMNQSTQYIPSGIKNIVKGPSNQQDTFSKSKNSVSSIGSSKIRTIAYTFGNSKQQENFKSSQKKQQILQEKKPLRKTKQQKLQCLELKIQYWINYDIERKIFVDNLQAKKDKDIKKKKGPKINLVSAVIKQTIDIQKQLPSKPIRESQSTNTHENSQVTVNTNVQPMSQAPLPVTIELKSPQKSEIHLQSRILGKSRNSTSSRSNKYPINMFNRSPKSLTSTRSKQYFKVPKVQNCVQFIKSYQPLNSKILMEDLVKKQTFKVISSNGKIYFGEMIENNIKHGFGIEISSNEIFEGKYENGNRKEGFLKQHDGVYEGLFQNNLRHGYGIFRWNDGQVFKGQWKMGTKNGYGVWTGTDGSYYEGDWHLSMQHGKGKFVHFTSTYQGQFKNFFKQGFGKETFPNGDVFAGQYKNGKPNGKGKYQWKDGTYYEGDFIQGLRDGHGKWHQNSNSFYEGEFKQDSKHGKGVQYYKDGSYLQGFFVQGQISKGTLYNSRRQVIKQFSQKLQS